MVIFEEQYCPEAWNAYQIAEGLDREPINGKHEHVECGR